MTRPEAAKKARAMLGRAAKIKSRPTYKYSDGQCAACLRLGCESRARFYAVGIVRGGLFHVHGSGHSWEEALDAAERNKKYDEARYAAMRRGK